MKIFGGPSLIGMLHIPLNTILAAPAPWREALQLPAAAAGDWRIIDALGEPPLACPGGAAEESAAAVERLSFVTFLADRMLAEAALYLDHGFQALMLENVAAPYFVRGGQPPVVYWLMLAMAERLRAAHPGVPLGLQILAFSDDWAMDIACRHRLDFIRSESALFEGLRPEGRTPNRGNLARLYMDRQRLLSALGDGSGEPRVFVDVHKKHTLFEGALDSLAPWLENILFQKLEGVIVTGSETGGPVAEEDLRLARRAVEQVRAATAAAVGQPWHTTLLAGSGVCVANAALYRSHVDAVIVGSTVKEAGYWERPLEAARIEDLVQAWNA
jgi:predicted TIM-barrel enzyme